MNELYWLAVGIRFDIQLIIALRNQFSISSNNHLFNQPLNLIIYIFQGWVLTPFPTLNLSLEFLDTLCIISLFLFTPVNELNAVCWNNSEAKVKFRSKSPPCMGYLHASFTGSRMLCFILAEVSKPKTRFVTSYAKQF